MALILCIKCNGTGTVTNPIGGEPMECPECRGIGQKETDWIGVINKLQFLTDEVEPILKSIEPKVDAQGENIDAIAERVGLMDGKIDEILKIVSKEK